MSDLSLKPARPSSVARIRARVAQLPLAAASTNHELFAVIAFSAIGLLVALNLLLRFPHVGTMLF